MNIYEYEYKTFFMTASHELWNCRDCFGNFSRGTVIARCMKSPNSINNI